MPRTGRRAILLGIGVGVIGVVLSLVPFVLNFEENFELDWLFSSRGGVRAPPEVVIVGIDEETAGALGVSDELDEWPRSVYANLVNRLVTAGASTIVFDLNFGEQRSPVDDQAFADAIGRAGNVVLLEHVFIESGVRQIQDPSSASIEVFTERRIPPIRLLKEQAIGTAPFPLPVVPMKVSRFWSFSATSENPPTLPVVALQAYALPYYPDFLDLLGDLRPGAILDLPKTTEQFIGSNAMRSLILDIRRIFRHDRQIASQMIARLASQNAGPNGQKGRAILFALISMYEGVDSPYLNFYGPPRSIVTVPFQDALKLPADGVSALDVAGKVVFVGYSGRTFVGQQDAYYSAFSQETGLNLSGAEIAATAFANLLHSNLIKPMNRPARLAFLFLWGTILTIAFRSLSTMLGIGLALVCGAAYLSLASQQFATAAAWWPIIVPILIQIPTALSCAIGLQLAEEKTRNDQQFESEISLLNPDLVDRLKRNMDGLVDNRYVRGSCLITDIEGYTAIMEKYKRAGRLPELNDRMHQYKVLVATQIAQLGGFVEGFQGDSCLGVWPGSKHRHAACQAAIGICKDLRNFNRSKVHDKLVTRIGLHFGEFRIGTKTPTGLGTWVSGPPLNIASRLESANKDLGTQVLVSDKALRNLEADFITRELGDFLVEGKIEALRISELIDMGMPGDDDPRSAAIKQFGQALTDFQNEHWVQASQKFQSLLQELEEDVPTRIYLALSKRYAQSKPDKYWNGTALRLPLPDDLLSS